MVYDNISNEKKNIHIVKGCFFFHLVIVKIWKKNIESYKYVIIDIILKLHHPIVQTSHLKLHT